MSFYQSDQVVSRRGQQRGETLAQPLMSTSRDGQPVPNPVHNGGGGAPSHNAYGMGGSGAPPPGGGSGAYPYAFTAGAQPKGGAAPGGGASASGGGSGCFRCKVVTVLVLLAGVSWSTYDFIHGARDDLQPAGESWVTIDGTQVGRPQRGVCTSLGLFVR